MKKQITKKIAIVTGASSGLGREFVKQISKSRALDEIWVIARRKDRLEEVRKLSKVALRPIALDLTEKSAFDVLRHALEAENPDVRFLVNAAGVGKIGLTRELTVQENDQMIDLNCRAAVDTTLTVLPYMSRGSELINICSVAGFQPLTGLNTYAATKAFLLNWTKALHHELLLSGIRVTALCPYWVKDTEFIPVAKDTGKTSINNFYFAGHAKYIVREALRASRLNLWVCSPGMVAKAERLISWVLPDCVIVPVWDLIRRL
ncbi:MAG: SDR family NAD(P)-dependent oxidoreductase [Firmicutes bacterium]|nr:SDR family NAD(P)-dependent oxidoreductase [Bacillota bacterium]MBQ3964638.1 SDR family NAD(P)-dependent oxidoreductase [Bacillota bacterium]